MPAAPPELISRLTEIAGSEHVLTHPHALATYSSDGLLHYRQAPMRRGSARDRRAGAAGRPSLL